MLNNQELKRGQNQGTLVDAFGVTQGIIVDYSLAFNYYLNKFS